MEEIEVEEDFKVEEEPVVVAKVEGLLEEKEAEEDVVEILEVIPLKMQVEVLLQDLEDEIMHVVDFMKTEVEEEVILIKTMIMMDLTDPKDQVEIQPKIILGDFEEGKIHISGSHKIKEIISQTA